MIALADQPSAGRDAGNKGQLLIIHIMHIQFQIHYDRHRFPLTVTTVQDCTFMILTNVASILRTRSHTLLRSPHRRSPPRSPTDTSHPSGILRPLLPVHQTYDHFSINSAWNFSIFPTYSSTPGHRAVTRIWYVPGAWPNPDPATAQIPVASGCVSGLTSMRGTLGRKMMKRTMEVNVKR